MRTLPWSLRRFQVGDDEQRILQSSLAETIQDQSSRTRICSLLRSRRFVSEAPRDASHALALPCSKN